ncbi:MAG: VOC family protein [Methanomassiliicoccales archaeon]|jgi:predicted enzyme related to lactoylglutathione lyase|nr:VOC family protein [Methanomassiliicoccales archaeon]
MPLGDPMGGDSDYQNKGKITRVWMTCIPVSDLATALFFYSEVLGLEIALDERSRNWVELGPAEPMGKIALYVPSKFDKRQPGGPTGVIFETNSIYELHRRLVDEGVKFIMKPQRQEWGGLMAILTDPDGNELCVVEDPEHYTRR